jgi:hypothetical protein
MENYCIKPGYKHRESPQDFDDTPNKEEWQREVYREVRRNLIGTETIVDFGCGSAYKLLTYFCGFHRIGYEIGNTLDWLRKTYPMADWRSPEDGAIKADVVICADVIEHVLDPDLLIQQLLEFEADQYFISTPDRDRLAAQDGPPKNRSHLREWNADEFARYISQYFEIERHLHYYSTQLIVCRAK